MTKKAPLKSRIHAFIANRPGKQATDAEVFQAFVQTAGPYPATVSNALLALANDGRIRGTKAFTCFEAVP